MAAYKRSSRPAPGASSKGKRLLFQRLLLDTRESAVVALAQVIFWSQAQDWMACGGGTVGERGGGGGVMCSG